MSFLSNLGHSLVGSLKGGFQATKDGSFKNPISGITEGASSIGTAAKTAVSGTPKAADTSASDTYAALTQQQWQNYVNTFVPIENQLISYATDKTQPAQAMAAAHTDVANAYGVQAGSQQRQLAGEGVTLTPQQQAASARQGALSSALADVQGQNVARDLTIDRQQSILGNPAPSASSIAQQATGLGV
jgi:hypothetical protein